MITVEWTDENSMKERRGRLLSFVYANTDVYAMIATPRTWAPPNQSPTMEVVKVRFTSLTVKGVAIPLFDHAP